MFPALFYGWWIVAACFLISVYVGCCGFFGFTAMIDPIVREFGWSYTEVSFASSLRGLEMGILAPIVGVLVDRFGPRRLILAGVVTIGAGFILLSLTQSLWTFYASFILLAFGAGGCTSVVTLAVVARWFRRNLGKAMGITVSGFGASGLLIPVVVWLIDSYGWRSAMIVQGVGMWALGIPLALVIRDRPEEMGLVPDGPLRPSPSTASGAARSEIPEARVPFREAVKSRPFLWLNLVEAVRFTVLAAIVVHVMPFLASQGIPRETAGLVAAAIPLFSIPGRFGFGWLGDVTEKRYVMAAAFLCMAAGLVAFHFAAALWPIALFLLLFSPGFGGNMVMRGAVVREYFGVHGFGKLMGITLGTASIGGVIGPTATGWVYDTTGGYGPVWVVSAGLIVLSMLLSLKIRREDVPGHSAIDRPPRSL
ncbi:MAG: MFS transporter [Syntrophales bacterium]|jgi:sugar phosphate permease|nr:MFS transporter [Syntrophales bacterium]MCU0554330.1 MFS transporter [Syntrophales bacterium]